MTALLLLLIPFVTATLLMVLRPTVRARGIALGSTLASLAVALVLWAGFPGGTVTDLHTAWLPSIALDFSLGHDGIGLLMLLLTSVAFPFIIGAGYGERLRHPSLVNALLLYTQCFLYGVFLAQNVVLFYIFYELSLIPVFFLLLYWGGEHRRSITVRFFIYTLLGGMALLFGIVYCLVQPGMDGSMDALGRLQLPVGTQTWLFWALFLAFAIKLPIFPFHGWQPDTYTVAPMQGVMVLAAVMLKMGLYGVVKVVLPAVPDGALYWQRTVIVLSLVGAVYAAIIALRQHDLRRLIAYSSMSHVGVMCAGLFAWNHFGLTGALFQALAHAVLVLAMLYITGALKERTGTSGMGAMGGLKLRMPRLAVLFMLVVMNGISLPLFQSFVGEWLVFNGLWEVDRWLTFMAVTTIVLGAIYMLYAYQRVMLGPDKWQLEVHDAGLRDHLVLVPLIAITLVLGAYPAPILELVDGPALTLLSLFP